MFVMVLPIFFSTLVLMAQADSPTHAERARGMVSFIQWGALGTISTRSNGTRVGDGITRNRII